MYIAPITTDSLLREAEQENLYVKLIEQINKDFNLANEAIDFSLDIEPAKLKFELSDKVYSLIHFKFAEYLNLLYIVDVPEEQIRQLDGSDLVELAQKVAFLILKREWMKVWFRNKYSSPNNSSESEGQMLE